MSIHNPEAFQQESHFKEVFRELHPLAYWSLFQMSREQMQVWGLSEAELKPLRTAVINQSYPVMFTYEGEEYTFFSDQELASVMDQLNPMHALLF